MLKEIKRMMKEEGGQGLTEYALILGAVVLVIYVALNWTGVKTAITDLIGRITGKLASVT